MTIFLTTHYMEEAAKADYIVIIDDGRIVAQGTPYEMKEQYSYEHIRIKAKKGQEKSLQKYLDERKAKWEAMTDFVDVRIASTLDALPLLQPVTHMVESFEVLYGTMDDVFLNITGKELRE